MANVSHATVNFNKSSSLECLKSHTKKVIDAWFVKKFLHRTSVTVSNFDLKSNDYYIMKLPELNFHGYYQF